MAGKHTNVGAKRARQARERLGLDATSPVACVLTLVEQDAGLPVAIGAMPDGVAGALYRNGAGSVAWVNGGQANVRQRFTLAHELGHVACGHEGTAVDTFDTIFGSSHDPREVEANAFAAELLAPRAGVTAMIDGDPGLEDLVRLAARFGISTIASLYRCSTLELVTPKRYNRLKQEIDDKDHWALWDHLGLEELDDAIARIEEHPRLSPALEGSALAALLRGEVSAAAAAGSAGCAAGRLADAAAALSR